MASGGGKKLKYKKSLIGPDAPDYLKRAADDVGLNEANSDGTSNKEVEKYIIAVTGKRANATDVPWCAYWVGGILKETKYPQSGSGMARSYLHYGTKVEDGDWKQGDIVVFWRGRRDDGVMGHVGFLIGWDEDSVIILGGNQGDEVCFQEFPIHKILAVRRPRLLSKSRTIKAAGGALVTETAKPLVEMAPDPTPASALPAPVEAITKAQDSLGAVQPIVDTIGAWKPYIKVVLTTLTVAFALLVMYYRLQDANEKGRA